MLYIGPWQEMRLARIAAGDANRLEAARSVLRQLSTEEANNIIQTLRPIVHNSGNCFKSEGQHSAVRRRDNARNSRSSRVVQSIPEELLRCKPQKRIARLSALGYSRSLSSVNSQTSSVSSCSFSQQSAISKEEISRLLLHKQVHKKVPKFKLNVFERKSQRSITFPNSEFVRKKHEANKCFSTGSGSPHEWQTRQKGEGTYTSYNDSAKNGYNGKFAVRILREYRGLNDTCRDREQSNVSCECSKGDATHSNLKNTKVKLRRRKSVIAEKMTRMQRVYFNRQEKHQTPKLTNFPCLDTKSKHARDSKEFSENTKMKPIPEMELTHYHLNQVARYFTNINGRSINDYHNISKESEIANDTPRNCLTKNDIQCTKHDGCLSPRGAGVGSNSADDKISDLSIYNTSKTDLDQQPEEELINSQCIGVDSLIDWVNELTCD